jgi:hypothetical protein
METLIVLQILAVIAAWRGWPRVVRLLTQVGWIGAFFGFLAINIAQRFN